MLCCVVLCCVILYCTVYSARESKSPAVFFKLKDTRKGCLIGFMMGDGGSGQLAPGFAHV